MIRSSDDQTTVSSDSGQEQERGMANVGSLSAFATRFARSAIWQYAAFVSTALTALLVTAYALRILSREEYGTYILIATVTALLPVLDLGLRVPVTVAAANAHNLEDDARKQARLDFASGHRTYQLLGASSFLVIGAGLLPLGLITGVLPPETALVVMTVSATVSLSLATTGVLAYVVARSRFGLLAAATLGGNIAQLLLVGLSARHAGILAVAGGALVNVVVQRGALAVWMHRTTPWLRASRRLPERESLVRLSKIAWPALVLSVSAQVISTTDIVILGAISGTVAVTQYKVGSLPSTQATAFLYRGVDVIFPSLANDRSPVSQEATAWTATRLSTYTAGLGLGTLILFSGEIISLLMGRRDATAEAVLILMSLTWLMNVPLHSFALLVFARGQQRRLVPVVLFEATCNLALTLVLVGEYGAVGAAAASALTLGLSNLIAMPLLLRRDFGKSFHILFWRRGVLPATSALTLALAPLALVNPMTSEKISASAATLGLGILLPWSYSAIQRRRARGRYRV